MLAEPHASSNPLFGDDEAGSGCAKLFVVSLEYAADHLRAAVKSLAMSERPSQERLQVAWDDHVQML
jgi:hypothetical protein